MFPQIATGFVPHWQTQKAMPHPMLLMASIYQKSLPPTPQTPARWSSPAQRNQLTLTLRTHPKEFSDIYTAVIAAGEQSGNLGLVLERLADDLEEQQALKSKLMGAALYPAIVTVVAIIIVLFLVGYVVPQVANVFVGTKKALPFLTVAMLATSDFVRSYGWWVLAALVLIALGVHFALKNPVYREKFDAAFLNMPVIGKLARGYNAARFASTLAMLASAGVPILKTL